MLLFERGLPAEATPPRHQWERGRDGADRYPLGRGGRRPPRRGWCPPACRQGRTGSGRTASSKRGMGGGVRKRLREIVDALTNQIDCLCLVIIIGI